MTFYEREPKFKLFGFKVGNKDENEITAPQALLIKEEWVENTIRVSLRGAGQWRGGYIRVVDSDTVVLGRQYDTSVGPLKMIDGIEATLVKDEINSHPLVGQLLHWKP